MIRTENITGKTKNTRQKKQKYQQNKHMKLNQGKKPEQNLSSDKPENKRD